MITIVDNKLGNVQSLKNILARIGVDSIITSEKEVIGKAKKIILPGVGSFDSGMRNMHKHDIVQVLTQKVLHENIPVLGICLGMQLMANGSDEGSLPGLGWIDAWVKKFDKNIMNDLKIPHMGWNILKHENKSRLFVDIGVEPRFYFVHSYYMECVDKGDVIATCDHGNSFVAAINYKNIWGVQFHPEKSHKFGMQLMKNFCNF